MTTAATFATRALNAADLSPSLKTTLVSAWSAGLLVSTRNTDEAPRLDYTPQGDEMTNPTNTGPNMFWTWVWIWCGFDVPMFMAQRDKVLNAPVKRRRYRGSR